MKYLKSSTLALLAAGLSAGTVHAQNAPISYTTGAFSTDAVLTLAGASAQEVYGVDFGSGDPGTTTTANLYTFANSNGVSGNVTVANATSNEYSMYISGHTSGDTSFDQVLNNGSYFTGGTITLENLTPGVTYHVLSFFGDTVNDQNNAGAVLQDRDTATPVDSSNAQVYDFQGTTDTTDLGGYILGTFTADGSGTEQFIQTISANGINGFQGVLVETVPEPGTYALLGLGFASLLVIARNRRPLNS